MEWRGEIATAVLRCDINGALGIAHGVCDKRLTSDERSFAAAGGNPFGRFNLVVTDDESDIEIVHRGADVARQEIQNVANIGRSGAVGNGHGQVLFAGAERSEPGMAGDDTSWKACVGGNGFVAGVACDAASVRMADDTRHDENGGLQSERRGKLREACSVVVNDGSGRSAMQKFLAAKAGERRGSKKSRGSRGNHFVDCRAALFDGADEREQVFVAFVGSGVAFQLREVAEVAVVVMQAAKIQTGILDCLNQRDDFSVAILFDAGAVHSGINVEKNANARAAPLQRLRFVFGQDRNADLWKRVSDFADAAGISANNRIGDEYIARTGLTRNEQFQSGGTLEICDAALDEHAHRESELGGFYMSAPTTGVAAQRSDDRADVRSDGVGIEEQRGRHHVFGIFDAEAFIPGERGQ